MVCSSGPMLITSITGRRMLLLTCLIAFLAIQHGFCLYEDQIHKWDWRQRFIGIDVDNCMRSINEDKNLIFCATGETNVIAAINRKGGIAWRNVQEAQAKLIVSSLTQDNGLITVSVAKTKNESKLYMRRWSRDDYGYLIKERIAFLVGGPDCLYSIDPSKSLISTVCSENGGNIKSFKYLLTRENSEVKVEEDQWSNLVNSPSNVNLEKDCLIANTYNLICLTPYSIHHLRLGDTKWINQPLPEVLTDGKKFILEKVTNENGFDDGFFGIKTVQAGRKSERFHLYQVISDGLKLKSSFPNIKKITILNSSDSPNGRHFYGAIERGDGVEIKKLGLDAKTEEALSIKFDVTSHANGVHRLFAFKHGATIDFVLSYDDQRLVSYNSQSQVNWAREESLSSIIWSQFISLPYFSSSPSDELWKQSDFLFLTSFINRIYSQLTAIQSYLLTSIETLFKSHSIEESRASSETEDQETSLISDKFGFHKLLFIITERGKIFVLDNVRKGKIIWTFFDPKLQQEILLEQRRVEELNLERGRSCDKLPIVSVHLQRSDLFSPLVTIVSPRGYLIAYNPLEGKLEDRVDLNIQVKQSLLMHHPNEEGVKGLVLMDDSDKLFFYPNTTRQNFIAHKDSYYMLVAKQTSELLQGYSFHHLKETKEKTEKDVGRRVWSFSLPPLMGSCLKMQWKEVEEHVHSQGKVLADRAVLYKYLNPNLVALVNRGEEKGDEEGGKVNVVQFYLLDTITGSIYYSVIHRRASDPVHLVHSENFVIYSFYNEKQRRIEISSLELFEGKEMPPPPPVRHPPRVVEHLSFIFPTGIQSMKETRTIRGITNKHILIALTSGGILSLPKIFLDPRRASLSSPKYASSAAAMEEGGVYLPPYIPELPIPSEGIINYNQSIVDVNRIYVGVSSLESTCLLFITGLDIYYTRVTPSKTFDILKDDFDHYLIIIVLVALLLCSIATKYLAARKTLNAAWK